jgi:hypothetical protein
MMTMRTITIGDVHGCLDELDELVRLCAPVRGDRLVFLGDLVDRGPDPAGVVRRVRELGAECLLGNHEEKLVRWMRHEARGGANPMHVWPERIAEWRRLRPEDIAWLDALPGWLDLGNGWLAVHAGFETDRPPAQQKARTVCRVQFLDVAGRHVSTSVAGEQPEGSVRWTMAWRGPASVVYGHAVFMPEPRSDEPAPGVRCVGIDTGCVHGGRLTAMILHAGGATEFAHVPARRAYAGGPAAEA